MSGAGPDESESSQPSALAIVVDDWALRAVPGLCEDLAAAGALVMRSFQNTPNPLLLRRYRGAAVVSGPDRTGLLARLERSTATVAAPVIAILPPGVEPEAALRGPGVVDVVPRGARDVARRVLLMATVPIVGARRTPEPRNTPRPAVGPADLTDPDELDVVAIASSTGGVWVLAEVLRALPVDRRAVVIAQHMEAEFVPFFAQWLNGASGWATVVVSGTAPLSPGVACVPAGGYDIVLEGASVRAVAPRGRFVPSADRLFESAASLGARTTAIVLSGMGSDGAAGLATIAARGGRALCQAPGTAVVPSMPECALARARGAIAVRPEALAAAAVGPGYGAMAAPTARR